MDITRDHVIEVVKQCFDPEIPVNIWDLGLIYDIEIPDSDHINIRMSLTTAACPSAQQIPETLRHKLLTQLPAKEVRIDVVFDPPWTPERITEQGKKKLGLSEPEN